MKLVKTILITMFWVSVVTALVVLVMAANVKNKENALHHIVVERIDVKPNYFISNDSIINFLHDFDIDTAKHSLLATLPLRSLEENLEQIVWIKNAEVYINNANDLCVRVEERKPVARVFNMHGQSVLLDVEGNYMPVAQAAEADVPLFTQSNFDFNHISAADSAKLAEMRQIGSSIQQDTFLFALIDQIVVHSNYNYELLPKIGNQHIWLGDFTDYENKLEKLKLFYKKVISKVGFNQYRTIDLSYNKQVIAKKLNMEDRAIDSLQALQIMQEMASAAMKQAEDSARASMLQPDDMPNDNFIIEKSTERDEGTSSIPDTVLAPLLNLPKTQPKAITQPQDKAIKPIKIKP